ncbi:activin receptor type-2B [Anthonomus grandis grandis]|uniref:activin receptor type-2B n=1 Tax=Anthonomus grandis grandis TaxID=2921223 RepID=UPI00216619CE|nr:activin receptor type-2B [Anthonomus grandis grandis]
MLKMKTYYFSLLLISPIIFKNSAANNDIDTDEAYTVCAYHKGTIEHLIDDGPEEIDLEPTENSFRKCKGYCYTLWQEDGENRSIVMSQGCWDLSGEPSECDKSACLSDKPPLQALNNTKFCCCSKDKCNVDFSDIYVPTPVPPTTSTEPSKKEPSISIFIWTALAVVFTFIVLTVSVTVYYFWKRKPKKSDLETGHHTVESPTDYSLDKLKLVNIIGQGKYGSVWRGLIDDQEVAVKIFPSHYRNCFFSEQEIYKAVGDHPCILKCFGGGEYSRVQGHPEFALLLSIEQESLQEYLKNNTMDLPTLSKMSLDIAKGLAHLHSDLGKPCVSHRDLNTKNILVRSDLSCCICDLGLAIIPRSAESKALSEAGTLRYMSPEVLEGAVNLRDCESALKQTDMYALGLVLWELGTRCADMQNSEPQAYSPPFYKETGENPTLEQMQNLVSRRKCRPLWPVSWKDTAAARLLSETAEDCWDQDAEARLTALCVVERFLDLPNMKGRVLHPSHPPASPTPLINNNHLHDNGLDISAATVDTLLSPTVEEYCKNSNQLVVCAVPLQPHQGRNPCLERNLLTGSSDSLLIDKSSKHCTSSDSQNLIPNELLNYQVNNRANPIPYVQNPVYGFPKQQNVAQPVAVANNNHRKKFKWSAFKKLLHSKKNSDNRVQKEMEVRLKNKVVNGIGQPGVTTALLGDVEVKRPCTLGLSIAKPQEFTNNSGVTQILKGSNSLSRQRSLEQFTEVFSSTTDLSRLKDPSQRVKTPGDVPPSVRKTRGKAATNSARFSLYDDRMMSRNSWGSAPNLDPPSVVQDQINSENSASVSSF